MIARVTDADGTKPDRDLQRAVLQYLNEYEADTIDKMERIAASSSTKREGLSQSDIARLLLARDKWISRLRTLVEAPLQSVWNKTLTLMTSEGFDPFERFEDPRVIQRFRQQTIQLAEGVHSVTEQRVRRAMVRAGAGLNTLDQGVASAIEEVLPKLTKELHKVFGSKRVRAETIARTETGKAQNDLIAENMKRTGVKTITWVTSHDGDVRESHAAAGRQDAIPLGSTFGNGLRWPLDPRGSAGEVVNCRCTMDVEEMDEEIKL